jgi:hypothetical protein
VAVFSNDFSVTTRNYVFQFDATAWGWIHLLMGLVVIFAGWGCWRAGPGPGWSGSPWRC